MSRSNIDTTANGEKYQTDRLIVAFCIDIKKLGSKKLELEIAAINNMTSQEFGASQDTKTPRCTLALVVKVSIYAVNLTCGIPQLSQL